MAVINLCAVGSTVVQVHGINKQEDTGAASFSNKNRMEVAPSPYRGDEINK